MKDSTVEQIQASTTANQPYPLVTLAQWVTAYTGSLETRNTDVLLRTVNLIQTCLHEKNQALLNKDQLIHMVDTGLETARILADLAIDADTIAAALLIGPVHEKLINMDQVSESIGEDVAHMIKDHGHTYLFERIYESGNSGNKNKQELHRENLRRMFLALARDIRVVTLILASRLVAIRQCKHAPDEIRKAVAQETMDIYAPLANRLGIGQIKWEMEDLAFRYLENERYMQVAKWLDEKRTARESYIADFTALLTNMLDHAGIKGEVSGRPKHIYSINRKMTQKQLSFEQLYDIRAVRIMVHSVAKCYEVLGLIHSHWTYLKEEFDDYIASPKGNNYQSLHTAINGPDDQVVEVQIRTYDMHLHAELGVAAHWRYKESNSADQGMQEKINWFRQMLEWKDELSAADNVDDDLKNTQFNDRVYVLTPNGRIIDLPMDAMPLDFAYAVHTEVGHHCRGIKLDGKIAPLTTALKSGQVVEVITSKGGGPSRDWLGNTPRFVVTSKARSKIQQWFKQQDYDIHVEVGRSRLEKEFVRINLSNVNLEKLASSMHYDCADRLFVAISQGEVKSGQVANMARKQHPEAEPEVTPASPRPQRRKQKQPDILVEGVGDLMVNYGKCCNPVHGDRVTGYITRSRGVTVHRSDCANIKRYQTLSPDRLLAVQWNDSGINSYPVDIHITAEDRQGLVRDVTALLAGEKLNIFSVNTYTDRKTLVAHMSFSIEISDLGELNKLLRQLSQLSNVIDVQRKQ